MVASWFFQIIHVHDYDTQYDSKTVLYMQHSHNTRVIQYIHCTCNIALTYVLTVFLIFFFRTFKYIERELPKVPKHIPVLVLVSKYFHSISLLTKTKIFHIHLVIVSTLFPCWCLTVSSTHVYLIYYKFTLTIQYHMDSCHILLYFKVQLSWYARTQSCSERRDYIIYKVLW